MKSRITNGDIAHLFFMYSRLVNKHGENPNFDYMHKLDSIITNLKLDYANGESDAEVKELRTKEAYEKVELSLSEKVALLDSGEWLYTNPKGSAHIDLYCAKSWSLEALDGIEVYRKVTKPIEWWEDAVEFAKGCRHVNTAVYLPEYDSIDIDGSMTRNEVCDFARILLEQGE